MPGPQSTSFIPKRPTKGTVKTSGVRKIYLLSYLSYVLFFCTIIATGGIFIYQFSLSTQLEHQKELLDQERSSFSQSDLERIRELELRINTATRRLNSHISVFSLFTALEQSIIDPVYFTSFQYNRLFDGSPNVVITANTDSFDALLFQQQVIQANPTLQSLELSEVAMRTLVDAQTEESQEVVSFSLFSKFDPSVIQYSGIFKPTSNEPQEQPSVEETETESTEPTDETTETAEEATQEAPDNEPSQ